MSKLEIEPPAGCENFEACKDAKKCIQMQKEKFKLISTPISKPTTSIRCEPRLSYSNTGLREITVFSVFSYLYPHQKIGIRSSWELAKCPTDQSP